MGPALSLTFYSIFHLNLHLFLSIPNKSDMKFSMLQKCILVLYAEYT